MLSEGSVNNRDWVKPEGCVHASNARFSYTLWVRDTECCAGSRKRASGQQVTTGTDANGMVWGDSDGGGGKVVGRTSWRAAWGQVWVMPESTERQLGVAGHRGADKEVRMANTFTERRVRLHGSGGEWRPHCGRVCRLCAGTQTLPHGPSLCVLLRKVNGTQCLSLPPQSESSPVLW